MRYRLIGIALMSASITAPATAQASRQPSTTAETKVDLAAIDGVIEKFRVGMIARDSAALYALPLNDAITFVGIVDPATLAAARIKRPALTGVNVGSYRAFVADITSEPKRSEETFSNIAVHADGSIADVYFDYTFAEDGVVTNWGHESWGLVRTDGGWKISSIVYSVTLPAPAAPYRPTDE